MTGEPDGPPTLSGLLRRRQLVGDHGRARARREGARGQGRAGRRLALRRDALPAQLQGGGVPQRRAAPPGRQALGAHTFYVPAQLFETADRLPRAVRDPRRVLAPAVRRDRPRRVGATTRASPPCTPASSTATSCSTALGARAEGGVGGGVDGAPPPARHRRRCRRRPRRRARRRARAGARHGRLGRHRRRTAALGRQPDPVRRRQRRVPRAAAPARAHRRARRRSDDEPVRRRSRRRPLGSWGSTGRSGSSRRRPRRASSALFTRMVAAPSSRWAMHVAQLPDSHENGGLRPARRAASRIVSPGLVGDGLLAAADPDHQRLGGRRLGVGRAVAGGHDEALDEHAAPAPTPSARARPRRCPCRGRVRRCRSRRRRGRRRAPRSAAASRKPRSESRWWWTVSRPPDAGAQALELVGEDHGVGARGWRRRAAICALRGGERALDDRDDRA